MKSKVTLLNNTTSFRLSFILLFFAMAGSLFSQEQKPIIENEFPTAWVGDWVGELQIFNTLGLQQSLPMQLLIHPIQDSQDFSFTIIYGVDIETGTRAYVLKTVDANKGLYRIDEQNGIEIDAYLLGNKLVQRFEVMGNLLDTFIEKRGDELVWEIFSGKLLGEKTGDTVINGDTIPPVQTYPMKIYQKCILSKG